MKNNNKLEAVIFDLSGTIIDFGSLATILAMKKAFLKKGMNIDNDIIKLNMGIKKIDHIKKILEYPKVRKKWSKKNKNNISREDIRHISYNFDKYLKIEAKKKLNLIPNIKRIFNILRRNNIKIGATTGYPRNIVKIIKPFLKKNKILPSQIITVEDVKKGRPHPDMCLRNFSKLKVKNPRACLKIDDSLSGIQEGKNAKMKTVGLIFTGIQLGLTYKKFKSKTINQKRIMRRKIAKVFKSSNTDFILDDLYHLEKIIKNFNIK